MPINEGYYERYPSIRDGLVSPRASEDVLILYNFILENQHLTINRGVGMGSDIAIAPDMLKIKEVGEIEGLDVYRYKKYFHSFVYRNTKLQNKKD